MGMSGFGINPSSEETYALIRTAVMSRQPIRALYDERARLLCPHRLGWNSDDQPRVLCYQYDGESVSGLKPAGDPANWRCMAVEKLREVTVLDEAWRTAPNHTRP